MPISVRWTIDDLELMPENGTRYEIMDGELFMTRAPHHKHQRVCNRIAYLLETWSEQTRLGEPIFAPGLVFGDEDAVIPDLVWASQECIASLVDAAGHFVGAPELVIEVLSLGSHNERRDRELKLKLYGSRGVQEYWIVDWQGQQVEIYYRASVQLVPGVILKATDTLTSPILPGFTCVVAQFFR